MIFTHKTPLGTAGFRLDENGALTQLWINEQSETKNTSRASDKVRAQLDEYFCGDRKVFDLPLNPEGTEFQKRVWTELVTIPFGEVMTYSGLATRLGDLELTRAVGAANGQNPIWLVVPCHRVIGKDGKMVGYAGGLHIKEWLLRHEGAITPQLF